MSFVFTYKYLISVISECLIIVLFQFQKCPELDISIKSIEVWWKIIVWVLVIAKRILFLSFISLEIWTQVPSTYKISVWSSGYIYAKLKHIIKLAAIIFRRFCYIRNKISQYTCFGISLNCLRIIVGSTSSAYNSHTATNLLSQLLRTHSRDEIIAKTV